MNNIKISIIVPVYNKANRLRLCLDSILEQRYCDLEIICIDDCSSDGSLQILEEYSEKDKRVRISRNSVNRGLAFTRNRGMKIATGDYLWFVDADDSIGKNAIETLCKIINKSDIDVICFDIKRITELTTVSSKYNLLDYKQNVVAGTELFREICRNNLIRSSVCCQLYKRNYLNNLGISFREGLIAEDANFSLQALLEARKVFYLSEELYMYVKVQNSITTDTSDLDYFLGTFSAYVDMLSYFEEHKWDEELEQYILKNIVGYYKIADQHYCLYDHTKINDRIVDEKIRKKYKLYYIKKIHGKYIKDISTDKINIIEQNEQIAIYGAGVIANEVIEILNKLQKRVIAYIVSDNALNNPKAIYGVPVIKRSEMNGMDKKTLVIVAVKKNTTKLISEDLKNMGYRNQVTIFD